MHNFYISVMRKSVIYLATACFFQDFDAAPLIICLETGHGHAKCMELKNDDNPYYYDLLPFNRSRQHLLGKV